MEKTKSCRRPAHIAILCAAVLLFGALLLIPAAIRPVEAASGLTDAKVKMYEEQLKTLAAEKKALSMTVFPENHETAEKEER